MLMKWKALLLVFTLLFAGCGTDRSETDAQDATVDVAVDGSDQDVMSNDSATDGGGSLDPFGQDFLIRGEWTLNGETPTAANCGAAQAEEVFVRFYDDEGGVHDFPQLAFQCTDGSFVTGRIFQFGSYDIESRIRLSDGTTESGQRRNIDVEAPATVVTLSAVDFSI